MRMPTRSRTRTHEKSAKRPRTHWVIVVEYADDRPRRKPLLPHLRVAVTVTEPGPRLDALREKNRAKKPELWGRIRYDLMDDASFDDRQAAEEHVREMRIRLARRGHAVNGAADVYRTYVIELDPSQKSDHVGWLYVGQTAKPVAERIAEHREGRRFRYSPVVRKHFRRERPELADVQQYYLREDALLAESRLRVRLETLGYLVEGGQERYDHALEESRKTCSEGDLA
jgi:predicted GIY-YIG superfamily endonuclease